MNGFDEEFPTPSLVGADAVLRFQRNATGRDFVVGDVHGMFDHLRVLLERVEFDTRVDRLFSVGDLVDRGPQSAEALEWLAEPWFQAVRGNHEQFVLDSDDPGQLEVWVNLNGGSWWLKIDESARSRFRTALAQMPFAFEIETDTGMVGIVHADVPPMLTWDQFVELLEEGQRDALFYAMWSRTRIQGFPNTIAVGGRVDRVYCGHTPTREIVRMENVYYIDTGAVYSHEGYADARLTLIEVHPRRHHEFMINTNERI